MTIQFNCEHCRKEVQAPDEAGGKRGKCPFCGTSNYIPAPVSDEDVLALAPLNEEDERRRQKEIENLLRQERSILAETGGQPTEPKPTETPSTKDLHPLVVKYCLDIKAGNLDRAQLCIDELLQNSAVAVEAIDEFMTGKAIDPRVATMPGALFQGFLRQLKQSLQDLS